jgi:hypothetical protein
MQLILIITNRPAAIWLTGMRDANLAKEPGNQPTRQSVTLLFSTSKMR